MGSSSSTPHFTVVGTEIKGNKGACPRRAAASDCWVWSPGLLNFHLVFRRYLPSSREYQKSYLGKFSIRSKSKVRRSGPQKWHFLKSFCLISCHSWLVSVSFSRVSSPLFKPPMLLSRMTVPGTNFLFSLPICPLSTRPQQSFIQRCYH